MPDNAYEILQTLRPPPAGTQPGEGLPLSLRQGDKAQEALHDLLRQLRHELRQAVEPLQDRLAPDGGCFDLRWPSAENRCTVFVSKPSGPRELLSFSYHVVLERDRLRLSIAASEPKPVTDGACLAMLTIAAPELRDPAAMYKFYTQLPRWIAWHIASRFPERPPAAT